MWLQIISYTKGSMTVSSQQFKGRVGFISNMPSYDVSLYINNTQESDSGTYLSQIVIPNHSDLSAEISLDVKGEEMTKLYTLTLMKR